MVILHPCAVLSEAKLPYRCGETQADGLPRPGKDYDNGVSESMTTTAPFRPDHGGSLLHPAPVTAARSRREKGHSGLAGLKAVEDRETEKIVEKQKSIGLKDATDGEY